MSDIYVWGSSTHHVGPQCREAQGENPGSSTENYLHLQDVNETGHTDGDIGLKLLIMEVERVKI